MKYYIQIIALLATMTICSPGFSKNLHEGTIEFSGETGIQISSGDGKIKDSSSASSTDISEDKRKLSFAALYYIKDNVGVGVMLNNEYKDNETGTVKTEEEMTMLGILGGYNISIDDNSSIRLAGALIVSVKLESTADNGVNPPSEISADGDGFLIGVHYKRFLNEHISLNAGIIRSSVEVEDSPVTVELDSTEYSVGFSVHL